MQIATPRCSQLWCHGSRMDWNVAKNRDLGSNFFCSHSDHIAGWMYHCDKRVVRMPFTDSGCTTFKGKTVVVEISTCSWGSCKARVFRILTISVFHSMVACPLANSFFLQRAVILIEWGDLERAYVNEHPFEFNQPCGSILDSVGSWERKGGIREEHSSY